ncbi:hypothetical protein [Nocardia wallacei]|uniref:hypothetical protein n=1 Tax=Nocardia wallacei TaxID=480035 RepID=UPI002457CE47|nr:hypothetical protein [Nocardia wallacei]
MNEPQKYRKKPVEVEAVRLPDMPIDAPGMDDTIGEVIAWCGGRRAGGAYELVAIDTLEGVMYARRGDWIVRDSQGEFQPVKPDIFAKTYEAA